MRLSPNFTLSEFTASATAEELNIDNRPDDEEIANLRRVCVEILEPLRAHLNKPIRVTSGYRCIRLNRAIGSRDTSDHIDGRAADIKVAGMTPAEVCKAIISLGLPAQQIIRESTWTHVSIPRDGQAPARQVLTIDQSGVRSGIH